MTPADEATFIELWNEGIDTAEIGRQLNIPRGTVGSRAKRLVDQGKIQPRPRGGAYPSQRAKARMLTDELPPDQTGYTGAHHGTPPTDPTAVHSGTPAVSHRHTGDHPSPPGCTDS